MMPRGCAKCSTMHLRPCRCRKGGSGLISIRLLEIIGEAASKVSPSLQTRYQDIEWGPIISLRNRLIHGYDSIDRDILWQIIATDLPALVDRLKQIVEGPGGDSPPASTQGSIG